MQLVNKIMDIKAAISKVKDGDTIMIGGFGLRGAPDSLIDALVESGVKNLTLVSNDLGSPNIGLGKLLTNKMIKNIIGSHFNKNPDVAEAYNAGLINVTVVPQGTLAESIRAAGAGIPAYYTATGAGTLLAEGKESREFNGKTFILEQAIRADVALIRATKADKLGNLTYCKVARNFNPAMATAADYTIALVDEIVEPGQIDPETVVTPHTFVKAIVKEAK
ncbi:CoA transferase subunit A [Desulfovibrio sp. OttesenSCG-928-O18]|nr:CoA transferase subunit A [Desulfovibrio sp. OttesenSCG-928-O18]